MRRVKYTTIISYTVDPPPLRISSVLHLLTLITAQIPGNPWSVSCFCSFTFPRISHVLIGHLYIFSVEVSAQILCPFKNCLVSFLAVGFLYIFLAQVFFQICDLQIFSLSLGLSFHSLTVSFTEQLEKKFYKASVFHQFSISLHFNCLSPLNSRVLHLSRTQSLRWCQWQQWKMPLVKGFPCLAALPSPWIVPRDHITLPSLLFLKQARKASVSGPLHLLFFLLGTVFHRYPLGSCPYFLYVFLKCHLLTEAYFPEIWRPLLP